MSRPPSRRRLVLAGGGHAHLQLLADWIERGPPDVETVLISVRRTTLYSGMIPGWLAGAYRLEDATIDLAPLAERAGVRLVVDRLVGLSLARQEVELAEAPPLAFDWLSIATGGSAPAGLGDGADGAIAVPPIDRFADAWSQRQGRSPPRRVAVIGGGAAGVELAFALRAVFASAAIRLVAGRAGLLPAAGARARSRVAHALARRAIERVERDGHVAAGTVRLCDGTSFAADLVIVATGSGPPRWLGGAGLPLDDAGFVEVDAHHRVLGQHNLFAAGDAAQRVDRPVAHAGVHAVHAGPVVAANLRTLIGGGAGLDRYLPRKRTLYLLSTGDRRAILMWGGVALEGHWAWRLKDWIDRRWIAKFRRLSRRL